MENTFSWLTLDMPNPVILIEPRLAQTTAPAPAEVARPGQAWMVTSGILLVAVAGLAIYTKFKVAKLEKEKRFEEYKNRELQKKLKLALQTISKMEKNPDLIHSREFNLDYLRMRMEEKQFQFAILNQMKIKVKEKISIALRPGQSTGIVGMPSTGRQVDEIFDVEYESGDGHRGNRRVLFRVQIKLMKLPAQATSVTVDQIIQCMETFMSPTADHDTWQPTIQGRIASMHWDQKAKPTPLLVLEQSNEGVNVTFRTNRMVQS